MSRNKLQQYWSMHHTSNYSLSLVSEIGCHFSGKWHGVIWHHAIISTNIVTLLNEPMQARFMRSFSHGTIFFKWKCNWKFCLESGPLWLGLNMKKKCRSKQTKYYRLFSEDKVFVFRLKLQWHILCWVLMTIYARLAHVGQWYIQEYGQISTYLDPI